MADYTMVEGVPIDRLGNPMVVLDGCPNCGKGKGTILHPMDYVGKLNGGIAIEGAGPCSRRCQLQWEHAGRVRLRESLPPQRKEPLDG